jgi:hypothetical protein
MARKRRRQAIRIPDWVPRPVAHLAHIMYEQETRHRAGTGSVELLRRLACDPRMKGVWAELLKRKRAKYRTTADFFYSASSGPQTFWTSEARSRLRRANVIRSLDNGGLRAEIKHLETPALLAEFAETACLFPRYEGQPEIPRQQLALAFLFHQAFAFARQKPRPVSRTEAQAARSYYLKMAKCILADNTEQQRLRGFPDERLSRAVFACMELADGVAPAPGSPLLVKRKHGRNELIEGFVLELAATTKAIFGASLFGTVATLTNVAFDRADITASQIRKMVPSHTLPLTGGSGFL